MNYKTYLAANKAAQDLRKQYDPNDIMVKVVASPYGGYSITLIPMEIMIDNLSNVNPPLKNTKSPVACL